MTSPLDVKNKPVICSEFSQYDLKLSSDSPVAPFWFWVVVKNGQK